MRLISIDPGRDGAAVLFENKTPVAGLLLKSKTDLITLHKLNDFISGSLADVILLENVPTFTFQSIKSTATQFKIIGYIEALIKINCLPDTEIKYIYPQTWAAKLKKHYNCKLNSKELAHKLSEDKYKEFTNKFKGIKSKKIHSGIADCLAIAFSFFYLN